MSKPIFCYKDNKSYAIVDDQDYVWLIGLGNWEVMPQKEYLRLQGGSQQPMHRLIGERIYQEKYGCPIPRGLVVDHIDGRERNNVRSNLRIITIQQNARNQKGKGLAMFKGVGWRQNKQQWIVRVTSSDFPEFNDFYDHAEEAALAYDFAVTYLFGEHAYPNFPERKTPPEIVKRVIDRICQWNGKRRS